MINGGETSEARKQLVEILVNGRLLVSDGGKLRVAHEALLRRWERARDSLRKLADAELRKARLQRALAIAASVVFLAVAGLAVRQTQIADEARESAQRNEQRSFDALARIFAERAWQAMEHSDYPLAARYAVAGARTSSANAGEFRSVLGRMLHDAGESRFLEGHKGPVTSVAFSKDGTRVLSIGEDGVRVWDAASGRTLRMSPAAIQQAVFSPDGASIAAVRNPDAWDAQSAGGAVQVVEAASGRGTLAYPDTRARSRASPSAQMELGSSSPIGRARMFGMQKTGARSPFCVAMKIYWKESRKKRGAWKKQSSGLREVLWP